MRTQENEEKREKEAAESVCVKRSAYVSNCVCFRILRHLCLIGMIKLYNFEKKVELIKL